MNFCLAQDLAPCAVSSYHSICALPAVQRKNIFTSPSLAVIKLHGAWDPKPLWNEKKISLPVVRGFDHLVPGLSPQLYVQSEAQEELLQMRKHHFVELVSLSDVKVDKSMLRALVLNK